MKQEHGCHLFYLYLIFKKLTGQVEGTEYMVISGMLGSDSLDKHMMFRSREVNRVKMQGAPAF